MLLFSLMGDQTSAPSKPFNRYNRVWVPGTWYCTAVLVVKLLFFERVPKKNLSASNVNDIRFRQKTDRSVLYFQIQFGYLNLLIMDQCPLLEVDHDPTKNGWDRENGNANKLYESYGSINKSNDESNGDGDGDGDGDAFLEKSCRSQHRSISSSITNDKVDDSDGDGIGRYRGSCGSLRSRNRNRRNSGSLRDRKSGTSTRSSSARDNTITANVNARDLFDKSNNVEQQQQLLDDEITGRIDTIAALLNPTALQRRDSFFPTTAAAAAAATAPPLLVNQTSVGDTDLYFTPLQHISASNTSTANNNATSYNVNIGRNNINDSNINEDNNNHIIANNGEANIAFQCALRLAANSYKYGCVGYRIEVFLVKLLEVYGYNCSVIVNNSELIASIFSYTKPVTNVRGHHRRRRRPRKNINDHTSNSNSISSNGNGNIHDTKPRNNNKHASSSSSSSSSDNDNDNDSDNDNNNNDDDDDLETTITGLTTTAAVLTANDGDEMDNFDDFFTVNSDDDNSDNDFDLEESHGHHRGRHHKGVDCDSNDNGIDDDDSTIMSFIMEEEHFLPITISIPLNYGEDLYKLGKLSDVCHNILFNSLSLQSAMIQLEEIEGLDPQWNTAARFAAYVGTSVGYAYILGGNWNDVLLSSIGSMITWFNIEMFSMYAPYDSIRRLHSTWQNFFSAFFPALLASVVNKMKWSEEDGNIDDNAININTVVISCIISELPGLGIKKGISELARSRVLAGLSHVFGAVFTSFWLGLGGWIAEGQEPTDSILHLYLYFCFHILLTFHFDLILNLAH